MTKRPNLLGILLLAAVVVAIQLLATGSGHEYYLTQLIISAYYTVVVIGLCLVMGYAGQISLGHGAFFAIGGYTSAVLTTMDASAFGTTRMGQLLQRLGILVSHQDLYGGELLSVTPGIAFVAAVLLAATTAVAIGYPTLRLKGHYLAMGTLGFGLIIYRILVGSEFTGGADGISMVPNWTICPGVTVCEASDMRIRNYYIAWVIVLLVLTIVLNLVKSRPGRALCSIHGSEIAANAMGINTAAYKLRAFVISAIFAAVAGCFFTHYYGSIGPAESSAMHSVRYVALVAAGGMANVWGALAVSVLLTFLSLRGCFGAHDDGVFGLILILIMTLAPEGPLKPMALLCRRLLQKRRRTKPIEDAETSRRVAAPAGGRQ